MQKRAAMNLSLVLLQLALGAARPVDDLESLGTARDAVVDEAVQSDLEDDDDDVDVDDDVDNVDGDVDDLLEDGNVWPEEKNQVLENEDDEFEDAQSEDEDALLQSRILMRKGGTLAKGGRAASPRSRYPGSVVPPVPSYGYNRFYPSYNPSSYYYPPYQPSNYVPNSYYPSYPTNYPSNYFPSNPAYPPNYYPTNPAAYPISSPYDYYPMGVNEYARKHTIN